MLGAVSLANPEQALQSEDVMRAANATQEDLISEIRLLKAKLAGLSANPSSANNLQNNSAQNIPTWLDTILKANQVPSCNPLPQPSTCVKNCSVRFQSGFCGSYGPDYCGPGANCAAQCSVRFADGTCGAYIADYCGSYATCTPNCTVRFQDGTCGNYGPDICD